MSILRLALVLAALLAGSGAAEVPRTDYTDVTCTGIPSSVQKFQYLGPAEDAVGFWYNDELQLAAHVTPDGRFSYYGLNGTIAFFGKYISHEYGANGTYYENYIQYTLDDFGTVIHTEDGCETGLLVGDTLMVVDSGTSGACPPDSALPGTLAANLTAVYF